MRDKAAAYREQKLTALVKSSVPFPEVYFVGDFESHRFAITEYMPGRSLRDLLLNHPNDHIESVMLQVDQILASIQKYQFPISGFFIGSITNDVLILSRLNDHFLFKFI